MDSTDPGVVVATGGVIDAALLRPAPSLALGAQLAHIVPDLAAVEVGSVDFQPQRFAAAGHCALETRSDLQSALVLDWQPAATIRTTAWWTTYWRGTLLHVVLVAWHDDASGDTLHYAVLGADLPTCHGFIAAVCAFSRESRGDVLVFADSRFYEDGALRDTVMAADFEQLVLPGPLKDQIRDDFAHFLASRELYESHAIPWKRGALLSGPSGNGKTSCVHALAKELALPAFYVRSFESPHAVQALFERARRVSPCLVVVEDVEVLLTDATRSCFLEELDQVAPNAGIIVLATTRHADRLDAALVERPSRFVRRYHFGPPDLATRRDYITRWNGRLREALRVMDTEADALATQTDGFSFAQLDDLFASASMRALAQHETRSLYPIAVDLVQPLHTRMSR